MGWTELGLHRPPNLRLVFRSLPIPMFQFRTGIMRLEIGASDDARLFTSHVGLYRNRLPIVTLLVQFVEDPLESL